MRENRSAYQRLWFRPRILRDVTNIDFNSTILGHKVSSSCSDQCHRTKLTTTRHRLPFVSSNIASRLDFALTFRKFVFVLAIYITATALGKLGHPDGEKNLTWAGAKQGIIQVRGSFHPRMSRFFC